MTITEKEEQTSPAMQLMFSTPHVKIYRGDARRVLREELAPNSIDMVMTSPPYWGLRDYGTEPALWDENPGCQHELCAKCGAWRGQLGQEPTIDIYIDHLMQIFDELTGF